MRVRATSSSLLIAISLCLSCSFPTLGQRPQERTWKDASGVPQSCKQWAWKDRDGHWHSCGDLDKILEENELWVGSDQKSGARADLNGADLDYAGLSGAYLRRADLSGGYLSHANLSGAFLLDADLSHAYLYWTDLRSADLTDTDLSGAWLEGANLSRSIFEPKKFPALESIAGAQGLELLTYFQSPAPLTQLRKQFQDAGFREQERAITCALNRREAELDSFVERWFKRIAFDLTCAYGFQPGRPLRIVGLLWLLFSIVYVVFIRRSGKSKSGIYVVAARLSGSESHTRTIQVRSNTVYTPKQAKKRFGPLRLWWLRRKWLRREWRVLRAAMFFSLMSAFNIGFRDINFGRWLRLLTKREYDLKAVGWARTVSGFQALLSVYLIALWVLSYFGRPFG